MLGFTLDLTAEDDQLLAQQGILRQKFRLGAGKIVQRAHEEGAARWSRPFQQTLPDSTEQALESAFECNEQSSHSSLGSFMKKGEVRDAGEYGDMLGFYSDHQRICKQVSQQKRISPIPMLSLRPK